MEAVIDPRINSKVRAIDTLDHFERSPIIVTFITGIVPNIPLMPLRTQLYTYRQVTGVTSLPCQLDSKSAALQLP